MASQKPILLVLSNPDDIAKISSGLTEKGHVFEHSKDGGSAMDMAIKNPPAAVVCDVAISGAMTSDRLFNNLKNNPNTASASFVFLSDHVTEIKGFRPSKDALLIRPFKWDELYGMLKQALIFGKEDDSKHIAGNLAQMSLVDILQVLHYNQKEGVLTIDGKDASGKIYLKGGQIFNAVIGDCEKEKALYRFFTWPEGDFEFKPETVSISQKITTSTGNLLMEGARQLDEFEKDKRKFPKDNSTLKINIDTATLPKGLKPIISEILFLIPYYPTVREVVNHCTFPDYDVYMTLSNLITKNVISEIKEADEKAFTDDFVSPSQAVRIKEMITSRWGENINVNFGRVFIMSSSVEATEALIRTFAKLSGFHPYRDVKTSMADDFFIGELGLVRIYGDLEVVLYAAPYAPEMLPLVEAFYPNLMGMIVLADDNFSKVAQDLNATKARIVSKRRIPLLHVAQSQNDLSPDEKAYIKRLVSLKPEEDIVTFIPDRKETAYAILKAFFEKLGKEDSLL